MVLALKTEHNWVDWGSFAPCHYWVEDLFLCSCHFYAMFRQVGLSPTLPWCTHQNSSSANSMKAFWNCIHYISKSTMLKSNSVNLGMLLKLYICEHYGKRLFSAWAYFFLMATITMTKVIVTLSEEDACLLFPTILHESLFVPYQLFEGDRWCR